MLYLSLIHIFTELKEGGKRDEKDVKIFPGYVLVRMEMDDDAWTCVRDVYKRQVSA